MPNIPVTGLSGLGAALADAGADYVGRTRQLGDESRRRTQQLQDESRHRGQQLEDVRDARAYSDTVRRDDRTARIEDQQTIDRQRARQVLITTLQTEGLLAVGLEEDEDAIAKAYAEAQRRGLDKLYQELLSTPGPDGQPLLTQADLNNRAKVDAAKDALGAIKAERAKFQLDQQGNAQATADNIQGQLAGVRAKSAEVAARIDSPVQQFGPGDQQVVTLASQLAEQAKPGSGRNREAVAAMIPIAQKQLNENALISHAQSVQAASRELESLRYNEAQLTNALRETIQTFKVAPSQKAGASVLQAPTAAAPTAPKAATAEQMASALEAVFGKAPGAGAPPPASAPRGAPLANPTSNPVISAGNDELRNQQTGQARAMLNAAIVEGQDIERELAGAGSARSPSLGVGLGGYSVTQVPNPIAGAQAASTLLQRKAANDARIQSLRAQLEGPAAGVTPARVSTPTSSQPVAPMPVRWWQSGAPAPAMGL